MAFQMVAWQILQILHAKFHQDRYTGSRVTAFLSGIPSTAKMVHFLSRGILILPFLKQFNVEDSKNMRTFQVELLFTYFRTRATVYVHTQMVSLEMYATGCFVRLLYRLLFRTSTVVSLQCTGKVSTLLPKRSEVV